MPIVVDEDPAVLERMIPQLPAGAHGVDGVEALNAWLAHRAKEYAVILGPNLALADAARVCESMRYTRPATSVILVRDHIDADVMATAMQAGCRDVVDFENPEAIGSSVARAEQLWSALNGTPGSGAVGNVISVFSPKGGVGKTTTAVNVAIALADKGSRKVCLVDLDLAFGDIAITMQLAPGHTVEEAIGAENTLDFPALEQLLTRSQDSLMVLAAPTMPDARDRVTPTLVAKILRTLKQEFDYVVVDTSPTLDELTLQALDESDECVVVVTLDVPTLKNAKVALETLDLLNLTQDRRHLVLNRADEQVGLDPEKVETILGMPVTTAIPSTIEIAAATNAGKPILSANGGHPASKAFKSLASALAEHVGDQHPGLNAAPETKGGRRSRRLLKRK